MIPKETIDKIYSAAKIEEVVSDYVTLHKRGANLIVGIRSISMLHGAQGQSV